MALWAIAAYLILRTVFRVDAQGLLAASAALGLALGIAAQDLLKNVFGGLIVVFDQPFQVGDKISVGGTYGEVVSIGLRSTRIVTADDNLVTVPNSQVVEEQVANANAGQLNCQVVTDLYLPGRVDERKAREIAFEAAVTSQYVFLNKPIVVLVRDEFRTTFVTRVTGEGLRAGSPLRVPDAERHHRARPRWLPLCGAHAGTRLVSDGRSGGGRRFG